MKRILLPLIVVLIVVLGILLYRSRQNSQLDVTPDARREIEKAKQR
jgi:hypothetical protein